MLGDVLECSGWSRCELWGGLQSAGTQKAPPDVAIEMITSRNSVTLNSETLVELREKLYKLHMHQLCLSGVK